MKLLAVRYCTNLEQAELFYTALELHLDEIASSPVWRQMDSSGGVFALHPKECAESTASFEVCFETEQKLETIQQKVADAGFNPGHIVVEEYGRHLLLVDPEGFQVRINESSN